MKALERVGPRVLSSIIIVAVAITIAASLDCSYFAIIVTLLVAIATIKNKLVPWELWEFIIRRLCRSLSVNRNFRTIVFSFQTGIMPKLRVYGKPF